MRRGGRGQTRDQDEKPKREQKENLQGENGNRFMFDVNACSPHACLPDTLFTSDRRPFPRPSLRPWQEEGEKEWEEKEK